jgi:DNA-binding CsgD family transcriptional regulator
VVVDTAGKALAMNGLADAILQQNDGLAIGPDGFLARRAQDTNQLRGLIQQASATSSGRGIGPGGMMTIPRPSGRRPFEILITPLREGALMLAPQHGAAVFLIDPENRPQPNDRVLIKRFGLTRAEARLTLRLAQGASLKQAAEEFGLSRNTVRSQLQKILEKTGTVRQGELISLVWNSLARIQSGQKRNPFA